jgi:hypothetical protein
LLAVADSEYMNAVYCAKNGKERRWCSTNSINRIHIPLSSYGLIMPQDELKQPKEKREQILESRYCFDKLNQNNIQATTNS